MNSFFQHLIHLFSKEATNVEALLRPEIDNMERLIKKFEHANLSTAQTTVLAGLAGGVQFDSVIRSGVAALKAALSTQGIEATDEELALVAQALTKHQATAINTTVAAVQASQAAAQDTPAAAPAAA